MPDSNIIQMVPDPLVAIGHRIDAAFERTKHGRQEWIEGSLELAAALLEAREGMGHVAFGAWLRQSGHDHLNEHDRADLMNLGRDPALARAAFERSESISYQIIWSAERIRYDNDIRTHSTENSANTDTDTNVRSTANGPWTNVIDARVRVLFNRGVTRTDAAAILTTEFPEAVAGRADRAFTKAMVQGAHIRLGLIEPPAPRTRSSTPRSTTPTTPAPPRGEFRIVLPDHAAMAGAILTREQIDPEFTGTVEQFMEYHGHVRTQTAEQQATAAFTAKAAEFRTLVRTHQTYVREMAGSRNPISFLDSYWAGWLRSPRANDITRLTEALLYLREQLAEAEAALALAVAARPPQE